MKQNKILVLYGSQTGNGEAIAHILAKKITANIFPMTDIGKNIELLYNYDYVILIISTTGDGEPPDNARRFYQLLIQIYFESATRLNLNRLALPH